jgi:hypothetical protein
MKHCLQHCVFYDSCTIARVLLSLWETLPTLLPPSSYLALLSWPAPKTGGVTNSRRCSSRCRRGAANRAVPWSGLGCGVAAAHSPCAADTCASCTQSWQRRPTSRYGFVDDSPLPPALTHTHTHTHTHTQRTVWGMSRSECGLAGSSEPH